MWAKENDDFRESLECAKASLGARREEWLSTEMLHSKAYDMNARTYDYFLKEEDEEKKDLELARQHGLKEKEALIKAQESKRCFWNRPRIALMR